MRRVAILQARMTSTRLPGKILMELAGRPMLSWQLDRLKRCTSLDEIVVATTTNSSDDPVVELADLQQVAWSRGSEHDVLGRYLAAARGAKADVVVRVTGDCPLIDPVVVDQVIAALEHPDAACDYASNVLERTFPRGLDTEALFAETLYRVGRLAKSAQAREHVTAYIVQERPELFVRRSVRDKEDNSDLRWTVDTPDDLETIRRIYEQAGLAERSVPYPELVRWVRERPEIANLNAHIAQKVS